MEKYPYCTSETFKKDISDLCDQCPLVQVIEKALKEQIVAQADIQNEILGPTEFREYIQNEIKSAQKAMQKVFLIEQRRVNEDNDLKKYGYEIPDDPYRKNRIKLFIWNKERIKVLNSYLNPLPPLTEKTQKVVTGLNQYKLDRFLKEKGHDTAKVYQLISEHSGRELMPFTIALLHEIQFLDYFFNEFYQKKKEGYKMLAAVFGATDRRIKGNINILNPASSEDPAQYTSHQYTEIIQQKLKGR